ncbi:hypothetical protein HFN_1529 [Helicobacter fennelliae MRY12-0050]|uniref:Uncharacterized protein n=1 Tax=Helicobacter fennelliae MRY12-0050 TaxID=1325130 RepID=T1CVZ4_9HELI|nr:hypothetical protein HFN_1529 [Helicobacter fennelliae MRY12-0050]
MYYGILELSNFSKDVKNENFVMSKMGLKCPITRCYSAFPFSQYF